MFELNRKEKYAHTSSISRVYTQVHRARSTLFRWELCHYIRM